jgi:hypothetical protein
MASIVLEYLDVMRFDGCTRGAPQELIPACFLGNLARSASSDIQCKNAGYDVVIFETLQFAVMPLDVGQLCLFAGDGLPVAEQSLAFFAQSRQRYEYKGIGVPSLEHALDRFTALIWHGRDAVTIDLNDDFDRLVSFLLAHVVGSLLLSGQLVL